MIDPTPRVDDLLRGLDHIATNPLVADTATDERFVDGGTERIAVVTLTDGTDQVPSSVVRSIGEWGFAIDSIERYAEHIEVVLQ